MSRPLAWVLGAGGLLGRQVVAAMECHEDGPLLWRRWPTGIPWADSAQARGGLGELAEAFLADVRRRDCEWLVFWCAGSGIVGSGAEALAQETEYLRHLLEVLGRGLPSRPGRFLLASSAGGVYGLGSGEPLTEYSLCNPISDYGRNKLRQESLVQAWARGTPSVSSLVARISNLYGPAQRIDKAQGLISHISKSIYQRVPVRIFVPLDTLRDFLYAEDCAQMLLAGMLRLGGGGREDVLKIFHSGEVMTIAGLMGVFTHLSRGRARMLCASTPATSLQPFHLHYRSMVWADLKPVRAISLLEGVQRVHQHMLKLFQGGALPPNP